LVWEAMIAERLCASGALRLSASHLGHLCKSWVHLEIRWMLGKHSTLLLAGRPLGEFAVDNWVWPVGARPEIRCILDLISSMGSFGTHASNNVS
jgi:hypothetical protein